MTQDPSHKNNSARVSSKLALMAAVAAVPLMLASTPGMAGEPIDGVDVKIGKETGGAISLNFAEIKNKQGLGQ